jgi:hypothetical protein
MTTKCHTLQAKTKHGQLQDRLIKTAMQFAWCLTACYWHATCICSMLAALSTTHAQAASRVLQNGSTLYTQQQYHNAYTLHTTGSMNNRMHEHGQAAATVHDGTQ